MCSTPIVQNEFLYVVVLKLFPYWVAQMSYSYYRIVVDTPLGTNDMYVRKISTTDNSILGIYFSELPKD